MFKQRNVLQRNQWSASSTDFQFEFPGNFPENVQAELKLLMIPLSTYTIVPSKNVISFTENATQDGYTCYRELHRYWLGC
jgi:hypothetical protein